jgi:hypothetical protein
MKMHIATNTTIQHLQDVFNAGFPYLKLMFFTKKHEAFEGSSAADLIRDNSVAVGSLQKKPSSGDLMIEASMPTWQVERTFEEQFGLHVQVFRKSGDLWLSTSRTDDLTLEIQNAKGMDSEHVEPMQDEPIDIREQE